MDVNKFNTLIRQAVNDNNAAAWQAAIDHRAFCAQLISSLESHDLVKSILIDVIDSLLKRKAEDMYGTYAVGDGVTILEKGHCLPATIIDRGGDANALKVQLDKVFDDGHFEQDNCGKVINFKRSHHKVYVHLEGRSLSRLVSGRKYADYSPEQIAAKMARLTNSERATKQAC